MNKAIFVTRDGKERPMKQKLAQHLAKAGKGYIKTGAYQTRDMAAQLFPTPPTSPKATTAALQLAEDNGLNISQIIGTGTDGAVTVADVKKAIAEAE